MITHSALKLRDGGVYALPRPARHCNLFREYNDDPQVLEFVRSRGLVSFEKRGIYLRDRLNAEQGFLADAPAHEINTIASAVQFLTREEAEVHARACGQITTIIGGVLTSEDLW